MFYSHSSVWSLTMCLSQRFPKYPPDLRCPCLIPKHSLYQASRRGSSLGREEKRRQPVREGFQVGTQTRRGSATSSALKPQKRTQRLLAVRGYGPRAARLVKLCALAALAAISATRIAVGFFLGRRYREKIAESPVCCT